MSLQDVLGLTYPDYSDAGARSRRKSSSALGTLQGGDHPSYDGIKHKPDTTFGNVKADVLADKDPHFHRGNFCSVIRCSHWHA